MFAALLTLTIQAPEPPALELQAGDLAAWRAAIEPKQVELAFEEIPWLPTFAGGVLAADREGKPLLFWAMNGHPLGCT